MQHARPGLSGGHGASSQRPQPAHDYADLFGGPARLLAGSGGRSRPVRPRRAASLRPARQSLPRPRRPRLARQRAALRGARAGRRGHRPGRRSTRSGPRSSTRMTGRRRSPPAYLHYAGGPRPATVITIHNLAFQGHFPTSMFGELGLPPHAFTIDGVEYYGGVGFLKAGLQLADRITTVSPTYAREIMHARVRHGRSTACCAPAPALVHGIVNGIDDEVWNPATDPRLPQTFSALAHRHARAQQDRAADRGWGWRRASTAPLFGVVSPPLGSEGPRPAVAGSARHHRRGRPACAARLRRAVAGRRASPPRRADVRTRSAAFSAMTRRSRISSRPAPISSSCPRVSSLAA